MKPYGRNTKSYAGSGCCPGHDDRRIHKFPDWSGRYRSAASMRTDSKAAKEQNRRRRHIEKNELRKYFAHDLGLEE